MSRNSRHLLSAATLPIIAALYGQHHYTPDDPAGGAGGGGGKGESKAADKPHQFTDEELNTKMASAVKEALEKRDAEHAAKVKADKELADKAAEKNKGEFEKLYHSEEAITKKLREEAAALALQLRGKDVDVLLRDWLAEHQPDYIATAKYIRPLIKFDADTDDAAIEKSIKAAAEQYVKDNPRAGGGSGAPSGAVRGKVTAGTAIPESKKKDVPPPRMYSTINSRF